MSSATPTADLVDYATLLGLELTERGARKLRKARGDAGARERLDDIAELLNVAALLRRPTTQIRATRRLDAAGGDLTEATRALVDAETADRQREYYRLIGQLERQYYARDSARRYAAFRAAHQLDDGPLGVRAATLLLAAEVAGCTRPRRRGPTFRARIEAALDDELDRLHPRRPEEDHHGPMPDEDRDDDPRREQLVAAIVDEHRRQRELADKQLLEPDEAPDPDRKPRRKPRRDLALALTVLGRSPQLCRQVEEILDEIRTALTRRTVDHSWQPNPGRYRDEVHCAAMRSVRAGELADVVELLGLNNDQIMEAAA